MKQQRKKTINRNALKCGNTRRYIISRHATTPKKSKHVETLLEWTKQTTRLSYP